MELKKSTAEDSVLSREKLRSVIAEIFSPGVREIYRKSSVFNTLGSEQNGHEIFKYIYETEYFRILIQISPKFVPESPIDDMSPLTRASNASSTQSVFFTEASMLNQTSIC